MVNATWILTANNSEEKKTALLPCKMLKLLKKTTVFLDDYQIVNATLNN